MGSFDLLQQRQHVAGWGVCQQGREQGVGVGTDAFFRSPLHSTVRLVFRFYALSDLLVHRAIDSFGTKIAPGRVRPESPYISKKRARPAKKKTERMDKFG